MRHTQKIIFAIVLVMACFSAYSLAQMNQVNIIEFEWDDNNVFSGIDRLTSAQWLDDKYTDYMSFDIINDTDTIVTVDGSFTIKKIDLPKIDYSKEFILFASLGEVESKGYSVKIKSIAQRGSIIEVMVQMAQPSLYKTLPFDKTYPYDIVKVNKEELSLKGNLLFIFRDQNGNELSRKEVNIKE